MLSVLLFVAALTAASPAHAVDAVIHVEGAASKRLERDIERAVPDGVEVMPSRSADLALRKALRKSPLPAETGDFSPDAPLVESTRRTLRSSKRDLAILVVVGKARALRIAVVFANDDPVFFRSTTLPTFHSEDEHVAWWAKLFEEAIPGEKKEEAEPEEASAAEPPPAPEPPPKRPAPPSPAVSKHAARADYLFALAADMSLRQFTDSETSSGQPRSYRAFPAPGLHVSAELYPILDGHVGFDASYSTALGLHSKTSDGQSIGTTFMRVDSALRLRAFTAHHANPPWLAAYGGYAYSRFVFDGGPTNRELPTAVYQIVRAGLDGRAPLDRVALSAGVEYNRLVSIDPLGNVGAASSGNGVTARAGAGIEIAAGVLARLDVRYTWLLFALERDVPSNVVDQYLTGSLGAELVF